MIAAVNPDYFAKKSDKKKMKQVKSRKSAKHKYKKRLLNRAVSQFL